MKKKASALAIVVAVIFSIFLFPFIFVSGIGTGVVFSLGSIVEPDREEALYQSFADRGGIDWVYDLFLDEMAESMDSDSLGIELNAKEIFPKSQMETIVYDVYHAIIAGEEYRVDLSYQKEYLKTKLIEYFDTNIGAEVEGVLRDEYGDAYDALSESKKQEAKDAAIEEARKQFEEGASALIEEELGILEDEFSDEINSYDISEIEEIKEFEAQYGYSLTDRTELYKDISLAGYILLGFTGLLLVVLMLCHLFRPSGFFTAGAFSLITGGVMFALSKVLNGVLMSFITSEMAKELAEEEIPGFFMLMMEDILGWCLTGFEKVGKIGLMTAVILILVGVLLLVIRKNQTEAEPASGLEM